MTKSSGNKFGQNKAPADKTDNNERQLGTILLVDDEEIIRQLGTRILEKSGYKVITASDGADGIAKYRENYGNIDVTILDMTMPGMDGKETMLRLRDEFPSARVLISTGHQLEGEINDFVENGICGLLQKPYRADQLTAKIRETIEA